MKVCVGVSSRHVHLSPYVYEKLFDEGLERVRDLDQPGQFASNQVVSIKNGDYVIDNVRLVGPLREYNQVEISRTDCYKLKVDPPVRDSGDLDGSLPITIIGPKGEVYLEEGLIIANRHIHITLDEVLKYGLEGVEEVSIRVDGEKSGILESVFLKVQDTAAFRLHLDTDDANAFNIKNGDEVSILNIDRKNL